MEIILNIIICLFALCWVFTVIFVYSLIWGEWMIENPPQTESEMFLRKK